MSVKIPPVRLLKLLVFLAFLNRSLPEENFAAVTSCVP